MSLFEFILLAPVSLFLIINPLSTVPVFLAITPGESAEERSRKAFQACIFSAGLLLCLAMAGQWIFQMLGITIPAFQISGGLVLSIIAIDMLRLSPPERLTDEEQHLAASKNDVALIPLAIPLLCGPGAITTVILLQSRAESLGHILILCASIGIVYGACYVIFHAAAYGAKRIGPLALQILRRLMGLLFLTVAIQFILNALTSLGVIAPAAPV